MFKVALGQFASSNRLDENLDKMRSYAQKAAAQGAHLVAFSEMAYFMGAADEWKPLLPRYETLLATFAAWAKELGIYLLPGTLREPVQEPGRYFNTQPVFDPTGKLVAKYRKIFLFQARLSDRHYDESEHSDAGKEIVVFEGPPKMGLSVCYDVRFPELFRALRGKGAQVIFLPAAFTVPTGKAHWETLIRARAIENQCFLVAPAQTGRLGDGRECHGHSLVVSPWGEVLADLGASENVQVVDLDLGSIPQAAARVDCWASRREDLFKI